MQGPIRHLVHVPLRLESRSVITGPPGALGVVLGEAGKVGLLQPSTHGEVVGVFSEAAEARRQLTTFKQAAKGCNFEFIMKDISTVNYKPQRLWEWAEIAMKVVNEE